MAPKILIKFCGFIANSKPNNILSAFPEKILKIEKWFLIFWQSAEIAPKPIDQSCSNSILDSPCKYLLPVVFVFDLSPKLRVVHIRKKLKISIFSKMALTILFKFYGLIVHSKPNNMTLSAFSGKILETRKIVFNFLSLT